MLSKHPYRQELYLRKTLKAVGFQPAAQAVTRRVNAYPVFPPQPAAGTPFVSQPDTWVASVLLCADEKCNATNSARRTNAAGPIRDCRQFVSRGLCVVPKSDARTRNRPIH